MIFVDKYPNSHLLTMLHVQTLAFNKEKALVAALSRHVDSSVWCHLSLLHVRAAGEVEDVVVVAGVQELQQRPLGSPVVLGQELGPGLLHDVGPQATDPRLQEPEAQVLHGEADVLVSKFLLDCLWEL